MISKSFGLLFFLKKQHGDTKVHRPIYLRITIDGVIKEMSVQRNWGPARWDPTTGRAITGKTSVRPGLAKQQAQAPTPDADAKALNAYLDTLQAKVHEARHQLLMSGKPVTADAVRNIVKGRDASGERPHLLLEIFQYHNDQVKALVGKEYSTGTLTKFTTVLNHTRIFLRWKYKDRVLPILSNQKMNAYLKEIADCCGITKRLTFHIARHTFATTITLSNGVPIETVSKMLGHRNLKTTQHYAKILDRKVSQDMQALKEKLLVKSITPHVEAQQQTI
jgi:hypothetical protein